MLPNQARVASGRVVGGRIALVLPSKTRRLFDLHLTYPLLGTGPSAGASMRCPLGRIGTGSAALVLHGIDVNSDAIKDFCRRWRIRELCVFGSILREDFRSDSDVDFLADYEDSAEWDLFDSMRMQEELESIVGRSVDVVDRFAIENDGNRFIQKAVLSTAARVYASR